MEENKACETLKFLCSYNGKILPPRVAGDKLRYSGGLTRVLAVDRSISYTELMVRIGEFCGFSAILKCQLPDGDLETLITITSDEDLANLIGEYDRSGFSLSARKIRAVLSPMKLLKTVSPPPSANHSVDFTSPRSAARCFVPRAPPPARFPIRVSRFGKPEAIVSQFPGDERSARVSSYHHHHHHHHQSNRVPRSYYWQ